MDRSEAIDILVGVIATNSEEENEALDLAIEALKKVSVYEQVRWERDMALQTLEEHGIGLGQIADETLSRTEIVDLTKGDTIKEEDWVWGDAESATTTHGRLIDADALALELESVLLTGFIKDEALLYEIEDKVLGEVRNAPTIVPPVTPTERTGECKECRNHKLIKAIENRSKQNRRDIRVLMAKMGGDTE